MIIALCLRERTDAFPGRRPRIPEVRRIAQPFQLRCARGRIWLSKSLRHCRQIEIRISKTRHDPRHSRHRACPVREEGTAIVRIVLCNECAHLICNMQILVLVQQRPVRIAFRDDHKNLLRSGNLCTLRRARKIRIQIIRYRRLAREICRKLTDLVCREVQSVAGLQAPIHRIAAINGLQIIQDCFIEEIILRHAGILPVNCCLPVQAAAKRHQKRKNIESPEECCPVKPFPDLWQLRQRRHDILSQQPLQCTIQHIGQHERTGQAHRQIELLDQRNQKRIHIIICRIEHELIEAGMELAVVRKACHKKHGNDHHREHMDDRLHAALQPRPQNIAQPGRHKRNQHEDTRTLAADSQSAPKSHQNITRPHRVTHIVVHPEDEHKAKQRKDCQVE